MSLLSVIQTALAELGQTVPASVVGSTDPNSVLCLSLANRSGKEMMKRVAAGDYWQQIRKQFLFNMLGVGPFTGTFTAGSPNITGITGTGLASVQKNWQVSSQYALNDSMIVSVNSGAGSAVMNQNSNVSSTAGTGTDTQLAFGQEAYPYPADLGHFIPQTGWDRNFRWQLLGPVDAQEWQTLKSGISPVGPRIRYRLMQGQIYLNPAPYVPTGQSSPISDLIVMEYASKNWVTPGWGITGLTQATQAVATFSSTAAANPVTAGDAIALAGIGGMVQANGLTAVVAAVGGSAGNWTATLGLNSTAFNAYTSGGTLADITNNTQSGFQADTDTSVISEDLLTLAIKWRWLRAKGLKYAEELDEYEDGLAIVVGREQMPRALPLNARARGQRLLSSQNVPDTGFGT